jgi:hypothetical protein
MMFYINNKKRNNQNLNFEILSFIKLSNLKHLKNQYFFFKIILNTLKVVFNQFDAILEKKKFF